MHMSHARPHTHARLCVFLCSQFPLQLHAVLPQSESIPIPRTQAQNGSALLVIFQTFPTVSFASGARSRSPKVWHVHLPTVFCFVLFSRFGDHFPVCTLRFFFFLHCKKNKTNAKRAQRIDHVSGTHVRDHLLHNSRPVHMHANVHTNRYIHTCSDTRITHTGRGGRDTEGACDCACVEATLLRAVLGLTYFTVKPHRTCETHATCQTSQTSQTSQTNGTGGRH